MIKRVDRKATSEAVSLGVASVVNGLAAYAMVIFVSRTYDAVDFAAFSVAWSIWAVSVAVLIFPLQHWVIWRSALDSGTAGLRSALARIGLLVLVVLAILYALGSSSRLFPTFGQWPLVLVAIGASSALLGLVRGLLAAAGRYRSVAWVIGLENIIRAVFVIGVVRGGSGPDLAALSLCAGLLSVVPFLRHLRLDRGKPTAPIHVLSELGSLAGATALAQVLVQFPPAFAEWLGESPATVSAIFATFALGRAPILVILALTTRLTHPLTEFLSDSERDHLGVLGKAVAWLLGAVVSAYVVGLTVGPTIVAWFFGEDRSLSNADTALVASGLTMAIGGVVAILVLLGLGASKQASLYWLGGVSGAIVLGVVGLGIPTAFFVGEAIPLVAATLAIKARLRQRVGPHSS